MEYTVRIHQAEEGGFWSEVPELPGCYSQGETIEETLCNSKVAIEAHLMALCEVEVTAPVEESTANTIERGGIERSDVGSSANMEYTVH
ncbi:MAG TPA: type II toxin-antitoxin system HicB family antitoxin [Methanothrix sp.]|nr:type II toxin-antitoxin system HicB family antitoxin [Methanothrix sp.]HPJ84734.1 type II toxin-antitoxin system HicB family antitoxin [Methanothrix sp.]HPR65929.1 type II toxin-antitoxin system HicB family antitoxin [Methanothrix sp.]